MEWTDAELAEAQAFCDPAGDGNTDPELYRLARLGLTVERAGLGVFDTPTDWEFWWGVFPRTWALPLAVEWGTVQRRVSFGPLHLTWSKRAKRWHP